MAAPADAATQAKLDADDAVRNDLLSATWDVTASETKLTFVTDANTAQFGDWLYFFLDTNRDGLSDYAISGAITGANGEGSMFRVVRAVDSTQTCQRADTTALREIGALTPQIDANSHQTYTQSVPTSVIGGAESFDWAMYANTWNGSAFAASGWDYLPDASNADPSRTTPSASVNDHCDLNGNGIFGSADESEGQDAQSGWAPMRISKGVAYPGDGDAPGATGGTTQATPTTGGTTTTGGDVTDLPADPFAGFTKTDTTRAFAMPKVTGVAADTAKERILRVAGFADFDVRETTTAKPPKGIGFADVYVQRPKPGTPLVAGAGTLPKITLDVYAGPRPKGRQDCMDRLVRNLKGMEYTQAFELLKEAGCRPQYDFKLGAGDEGTIAKVTPKAGDRVELQVTVPRDPRRNDLFMAFRESPNQLSFDAADWKLTADDEQRNFVTVQVVDRAGTFVKGASVRFDTSDVGAANDPSTAVTDGHGERSTSFLAPEAGKIDVAWAVAANDQAIYGTAQLQVKDRREKRGGTFTTTSGRTLRFKAGRWAEVAGASRATAAQATPFSRFWSWITTLIGGSPRVQQIDAAGGSQRQKVSRTSQGPKAFPAVLAVGGTPVGETSRLVATSAGNVLAAGGMNAVAAGGANAVAAGGANVVSAGGGNVVAAGGMNLATVVAEGRMSNDANRLISDNGLGVVAAGGGNLIGAAGGNLISDNRLGPPPFAVGNGLIGAAGGNVVAAGGLN